MSISRRRFSSNAAGAGGTVVVGGLLFSGRMVQQSLARDSLRREIMAQSVPLLTKKAADELVALPPNARNEIREYFHGVCLNINGFVSEICSMGYAEKLHGCANEVQQHELLNTTFSQKVVLAGEVLNVVEVVATEVGAELDRNWSQCCQELAKNWGVSLQQHTGVDVRADISAMAEPLIRQSLDEAKVRTYPLGQKPAFSELVTGLGATAIGLLPVLAVQPYVAYPVFVLSALKRVWAYVLGQLANRASDYQMGLTEHLSQLGNRVGSECEQEFRRRIADLHTWQEAALRTVAEKKVTETVPMLI